MLFVFPGIWAAHKTIDMWQMRQYRLISDKKNELSCLVIGRFETDPKDDVIHQVSMWFSKFIPVLLLVFWVSSFVLNQVWPISYP